MAERGRGALGEPMRLEKWTKLSREKPSAPKRQLEEDIIVKGEWGNFKSKVYGHAVIEHGARRLASELQNRARNTGKPQGHWKDDQFIILEGFSFQTLNLFPGFLGILQLQLCLIFYLETPS
jgi:hypothetical protein